MKKIFLTATAALMLSVSAVANEQQYATSAEAEAVCPGKSSMVAGSSPVKFGCPKIAGLGEGNTNCSAGVQAGRFSETPTTGVQSDGSVRGVPSGVDR